MGAASTPSQHRAWVAPPGIPRPRSALAFVELRQSRPALIGRRRGTVVVWSRCRTDRSPPSPSRRVVTRRSMSACGVGSALSHTMCVACSTSFDPSAPASHDQRPLMGHRSMCDERPPACRVRISRGLLRVSSSGVGDPMRQESALTFTEEAPFSAVVWVRSPPSPSRSVAT